MEYNVVVINKIFNFDNQYTIITEINSIIIYAFNKDRFSCRLEVYMFNVR